MEEYQVTDGSDLFTDAEDTREAEEQATVGGEPAEAEDTHEAEEQDSNTESEPAEQQKQEGHPPFVTVKHLGEEKGLSREEAITLAQKGMEYDHIKHELDQLRPLKGMEDIAKEIDFWAEKSGMNRSEYLRFLRDSRHAQAVNDEVQAIRSKYPEISEEAAKEMAELKYKDAEKEQARAEEERKATAEEAELAPWLAFTRQYPDIRSQDQIPPDVLADIESGLTPVEAMLKHEKAELQNQVSELTKKIETTQKNKTNKAQAAPSVGSSKAAEPKDPFLEGLGL
jgi:hypothetical protein